MKLILKRIGFYLLSFTWGIIMSAIGLIALIVVAFIGEIKVYHGRLYGVVGDNWGGVNLGFFFVCCKSCSNDDYLRGHEAGHGLQNIIWGPLFPFVIAIPSSIRYWYFTFYWNKYGNYPSDYDSIWFEKQATEWGQKYINTDRI